MGRASHCRLRLYHPAASGEHAVIEWRGEEGWQLYDLGSRNGTFVNGERLSPRRRQRVRLGDTLIFGCTDETWRVTHEEGAVPVLKRLDQDCVADFEEGFAVLQHPEGGSCSVYRDPVQGWLLDGGDAIRPIESGTPFEVAGQTWLLCDNVALPPTQATDQGDLTALAQVTLVVSSDEETARLSIDSEAGLFELGYRSHSYVLVPLATARLRDQATGVADALEGWVHWTGLADELGCGQTDINTWIHRTRRALARAGYPSPTTIVERQEGTGRLRIGASKVLVRRDSTVVSASPVSR